MSQERPPVGADAPPGRPDLEVRTRVDGELTAEEWRSTYATALAYRRLSSGQGLSLVRANESISLGLTHCTRTFAVTMELPRAEDLLGVPEPARPDGPPRLLVPVFCTRRGMLVDGFRIVDGSGQPAQVLPRADARDLATRLLFLAWVRAFSPAKASPSAPSPATGDPLWLSVRERVLELATVDSARAGEHAADVLQLLDDAERRLPADPGGLDRLKELIDVLARSSVVWAFLPAEPGSRVTFTYEFSVPLRLSTDSSEVAQREWADYVEQRDAPRRWRRIVSCGIVARHLWHAAWDRPESISFVRRWLGHPPSTLLLDVTHLHRAESYHLQMDVPATSFVVSQSLMAVDRHASKRVRQPFEVAFADQLAGGGDYRGYGKLAGHCVHLYTHRVRGVPGRRTYAKIALLERPPGATSSALTLGVSILALCLFALVTFPMLLNLYSGSVDVVAILLTVPVFFSVWLGRSLTLNSDSYLQPPLVAKFSTVVFGLASVAVALTIMICMALDSSGKLTPVAGVCWGFLGFYCVPVWVFVRRLWRTRSKLMRTYFENSYWDVDDLGRLEV